MQQMQVRSLGWEDTLEEEMASHSGILAWDIPWTEEPDGLQSMGLQKSQTQTTWQWNNNTIDILQPIPYVSKQNPYEYLSI